MTISDPRNRSEGSETVDAELVDMARSERRMTPLRRQIGLERLCDPSATESAIIKRAGGSPWTARTPTRNGIDSHALAWQVAMEEDVSPAEARKLGLTVLAASPQMTRNAAHFSYPLG